MSSAPAARTTDDLARSGPERSFSRYTPDVLAAVVADSGASMENRRAFLRLSAVGLAGTAAILPTAASAAALGAPEGGAAPAPAGATPEGARADWLFAPLAPGSDLGLGWRFARAFPVVDGGITVNLVHADGRAARVDVCALDGRRGKGPAQSELCDFIVMDGGDGKAPMDEPLARAVRRLAATVADNELAHADAVAALLALEPHADRVWRHPEAMSAASRSLTPGGDAS